jgi:hypothetical protein
MALCKRAIMIKIEYSTVGAGNELPPAKQNKIKCA